MTVFAAKRVSSGPLEGVVFLLSVFAVVVLLVLLVKFGVFLVRFMTGGKTRSTRWIRSCVCGLCGACTLLFVNHLVRSVAVPDRSWQGVTSTQAEMHYIKASITAFQAEFGMEPPSLIYLCEKPEDWESETQSRRRVKRLWPEFNFALARDLNRDGDTDDRVEVDGAECLVLFLGGVADPLAGEPRGFSKNPADPFLIDNGTRVGPFYEFERGRLVDLDDDGFFEFSDVFFGRGRGESHVVPYLYFSSYGGAGYRQEDVEAVSHISERPLTGWYLKPEDGMPYLPDQFQIVSAGLDCLFGDGGVVERTRRPSWYELEPERGPEYDNIANFHPTLLGREGW